MGARPIKIVYIAGSFRSGTTLLTRLLGEVSQFVSVGEAARFLFDAEMRAEGAPCGCGKPISSCPFWNGIDVLIPVEAQEFGASTIRIRNIPWLIAQRNSGRLRPSLQRFLSRVTDVYTQIDREAGHRVIVDSSKDPSTAYAMSLIPNMELHLVHVVREPSAVVNSWRQRKGHLPRVGLWRALWWWWIYNVTAEILRPSVRTYIRIRYEDFIKSPKSTLEAIARHVLEDRVETNFLQGTVATVGIQHLLAGNPDKFNTGEIRIEQQPFQMPWFERLLIGALTFPLRYVYGYWP